MPTTQCTSCQIAEPPAAPVAARTAAKADGQKAARAGRHTEGSKPEASGKTEGEHAPRGFLRTLESAIQGEEAEESADDSDEKTKTTIAVPVSVPAPAETRRQVPFSLHFSLTSPTASGSSKATELSRNIESEPGNAVPEVLPASSNAWLQGSDIFLQAPEAEKAPAGEARLQGDWEKVLETNSAEAAKSAAPAASKLAFELSLAAREQAAPKMDAPAQPKSAAAAVSPVELTADRPVVIAAAATEHGSQGDVLHKQQAFAEPANLAAQPREFAAPQAPQASRGAETAAPQKAAVVDLPPDTNTPQPVAREISWNLRGPDNQNAHVRLVDRSGEVQVSVRTSSQELAQPLRAELQTLVHRLQNDGFQVQAWQPAAEAANQGHDPHRDGQQPSHRNPDMPQDESNSGRRRDNWRQAYDQAGDAELSAWS